MGLRLGLGGSIGSEERFGLEEELGRKDGLGMKDGLDAKKPWELKGSRLGLKGIIGSKHWARTHKPQTALNPGC